VAMVKWDKYTCMMVLDVFLAILSIGIVLHIIYKW
jgi:hypothetical protein